jgi:hypothetical protein
LVVFLYVVFRTLIGDVPRAVEIAEAGAAVLQG